MRNYIEANGQQDYSINYYYSSIFYDLACCRLAVTAGINV